MQMITEHQQRHIQSRRLCQVLKKHQWARIGGNQLFDIPQFGEGIFSKN